MPFTLFWGEVFMCVIRTTYVVKFFPSGSHRSAITYQYILVYTTTHICHSHPSRVKFYVCHTHNIWRGIVFRMACTALLWFTNILWYIYVNSNMLFVPFWGEVFMYHSHDICREVFSLWHRSALLWNTYQFWLIRLLKYAILTLLGWSFMCVIHSTPCHSHLSRLKLYMCYILDICREVFSPYGSHRSAVNCQYILVYQTINNAIHTFIGWSFLCVSYAKHMCEIPIFLVYTATQIGHSHPPMVQ